MEPNNGVGVGQPVAQQPSQPQAQPQQVQQQQSAAGTPRVDYVPLQNGLPVQQPAQSQQQPATAFDINAFRQTIATGLGIQDINQVPTDPAQLARIVQGGYAAAQRLQQLQAQMNGQQQPAPAQTQQPQQPQNPLQLAQMPAGWETLVTKDDKGMYQPNHPAFANVAAMANQNAAAQVMRSTAVAQGQLLPEAQQTIESLVQQRMQAERDAMAEEMFMEANANRLFQTGEDGSRIRQVDPVTMQAIDVPSELGIEMRQAAQELVQSGARFERRSDLAKFALKIAEGRVKMKEQQKAQVNGGPPSQVAQNHDLSTLLTNHQRSGAGHVANSASLQPAISGDIRSDLRTMLSNAPSNANGVDYSAILNGIR